MAKLSVIVLIAVAFSAQDEADPPEPWKQKIEAASKLVESGARAQAEVLLIELVGEADRLGPGDPRRAWALETLGGFYMTRKRYGEADPLLRRALVLREKTQGREHPETGLALLKLAECLLIAKEKPADAVMPMLRRAQTILEKSRGTDDIGVARVLHIMALWHLSHREYDEAEMELNRALAIRELRSGPETEQVADLIDDLGDLHAMQAGQLDMEEIRAEIEGRAEGESKSERHGKLAEAYYRRALAIRERVLKPDHPDIAGSLFNLGQLATIRERAADGESYFERWLALPGMAPASARRAKVLFWLAEASMGRKDFAEAERRLARAQETFEEVDGAGGDEVMSILSTRGEVAIQAGRFDDAEGFFRRGLEVQAARIGPDDPIVIEARDLMANRYRDSADDRRAPVLWHRLKSLGDRAGREPGHSSLGEILDGYCNLLRRTNRVAPRPTEADLAYLKKVGAVLPSTDLESLARTDMLLDFKQDDARLAHIGRLYEIERLELSGVDRELNGSITDAGLASIRGLINLRFLDLRNAQLSDAGLAYLAEMRDLETLRLADTRVGDTGLAQLKGLRNLRKLDLFDTDVTDRGLESLERLEQLHSLDLRYTRVSQAGVDRLRRARPGLSIDYTPIPPVDGPPPAPPPAGPKVIERPDR